MERDTSSIETDAVDFQRDAKDRADARASEWLADPRVKASIRDSHIRMKAIKAAAKRTRG